MRFSCLQIVFCILGLLLVVCVSETSTSQDSAPREETQERPVLPGDAPLVRTPDANAKVKLLSIEQLLKKKNLASGIIDQLRGKQIIGKSQIKESTFKNMRLNFDFDFSLEQHEADEWQPVLASNPIDDSAVQYSNQKVSLDDRFERMVKFHSSGIDHFVTLEFEGVPADEKKRVVQLARSVHLNLYQKSEPGFWENVEKELDKIYWKRVGIRNDPQLLFCIGCAKRALKKFVSADLRFYKATKCLSESNYPARFAVDVHRAFVSNERSLVLKYSPARRLTKYYLSIVYWLEHDFRATPAEHRNAYSLVVRFITECKIQGQWDLMTKFMNKLSAHKTLPTWIRSMCRAKICSRLAWHWRGDGFAHTVPKASWRPFNKYQKMASEEYERAYKANPQFPEAAAQLIGISMSGHNDQSEDYWFDKAIEAEIDCMLAYRTRLHSLLPQWGGSVQEMYEFAKLHADKEQDHARVPMVLVDFHQKVLRYVPVQQRKYLEKPEVAKATIKAIDGVMASRKNKSSNLVLLDDNYYLTLKAIVATKGQLYDVARESFEALGDQFSSQATDGLFVRNIGVLRGRAYALTSYHADECREIRKIMSSNGDDLSAEQKAEIVDRCCVLIEKIDQKHAVTWLSTISDKYQFESDYALGVMADLTFDKELSLWACGDRTQFKCESGEAVLIDTTKSVKPMSITSLINAKGDAKIIEFDIALEDKPKNKGIASHFTPAVAVMDYRNSEFTFGLNRTYRRRKKSAGMSYEHGQFAFGWRYGDYPLYYYTVALKRDSNRIRLKITPGYFEAYLNDQFICRSAAEGIQGALDSFGICQARSRRGRGVVEISRIRIEDWYRTAPPIRQGAEKLVAYYKQDFEDDPTDKWASYWFAQATHMAGDTEDAIELYMTAIKNGMAEHVPAFFIGDCHDRQGDSDEALRWYQIAADAKVEDVTKIYERVSSQEYSNPCHWASARLCWLMFSSPNEATRVSLKEGRFCRYGLEDKHSWVVKLFPAMDKARTGDFNKALEMGRSLESECSPQDKPILNTVLDAWAAGEEYRWKEGDTPLYLELDDPIPFFRCFEDYLDPAWKGVY